MCMACTARVFHKRSGTPAINIWNLGLQDTQRGGLRFQERRWNEIKKSNSEIKLNQMELHGMKLREMKLNEMESRDFVSGNEIAFPERKWNKKSRNQVK